MRITSGVFLLLLVAGFLLGCAVHPVTLDKQFMIVSEDKEIAIGERSDPLIVQQFGYYNDPAMQAYVNEVGQKLVAVCSRKNIVYHFTVLDSPDVNAFACPGGYIYVTRGILATMNSEAELAGVLAHEIGHVVGRDSANMISQQSMFQVMALASMASGSAGRELAMAGSSLFNAMMLGYGREKEFLADSQGVDYMFKAGYDPMQMVALQATLGKLYQGPAGYAQYLTTHPNIGDRMNRSKSQAKILYAMNNVYSDQKEISATGRVNKWGKLILADEYKARLDGMPYGPPNNIRRIKIYTVADDDTLASIAGKVSNDQNMANEIAFLNGLDRNDQLYAGQKLKVIY